jgi:hypothetical protein
MIGVGQSRMVRGQHREFFLTPFFCHKVFAWEHGRDSSDLSERWGQEKSDRHVGFVVGWLSHVGSAVGWLSRVCDVAVEN